MRSTTLLLLASTHSAKALEAPAPDGPALSIAGLIGKTADGTTLDGPVPERTSPTLPSTRSDLALSSSIGKDGPANNGELNLVVAGSGRF